MTDRSQTCLLLLLPLHCNYRLFIISYFDEPYIDAIIIVRQLVILNMISIELTRHSVEVVVNFQT